MKDRYVVIQNGIVTNAVVADENFTLPGSLLIQSSTAAIGDTYEDGVFVSPPQPASSEE